MKVLLYLEAENYLRKSGIGRAIKHQAKALSLVGQHFTTNPRETYDLVHLNTYGLKSWLLMIKAQKLVRRLSCMGILQKKILEILLFFKSIISLV